MTWTEPRLILYAEGQRDWLATHAASTCTKTISGSAVTFFFTARDSRNQSRIGTFTYDFAQDRLQEISDVPVLSLGKTGAFDETGTSYPNSFTVNGKQRLLFTGWSKGQTVPFYNHLGEAEERAEGYERTREIPLSIDGDRDSIGIGSTCTVIDGTDTWLYYTAFTDWRQREGKWEHAYHIRLARRNPQGGWQLVNDQLIPPHKGCNSISKPTVLKIGQRWHLWFCRRGRHYSLGHAESDDGISWNITDRLLPTPAADWCRQDQCYPTALTWRDRLLLVFAGNEYGRDGIGYSWTPLNKIQ